MAPTPSRTVRRATAVLLAVGLLAACADTSETPTEPVGDTDAGDDAQTPMTAAQPVRIADANGTMPAVGSVAMEASSDMAVGKIGGPSVAVDFVLSDEMGPLPTDDVGYVYRAGVATDLAVAQRLAGAFGLPTEPQATGGDDWVQWTFGESAGATLTIDASARHNWWYSSNEDAFASIGSDLTYAEPIGDSVEGWSPTDQPADQPVDDRDTAPPADLPIPEPWGVEPTPPEGVPGKDEAEQMARDIITQAGFDADALVFDSYADEWSAWVNAADADYSADPYIGGMTWSFGFGADAALTYAGGTLAQPEPVGPWPLVDIDTALARLADTYPTTWMHVAPMLPKPAAMPDDSVSTDETREAEAVTTTPASDPGDTARTDTVTEGDVWTVTLNDVVADLWWVEDVEGNIWLLPSYRFIGDDGGWYIVPAVTDEYMIQSPAIDDTGVDPVIEPAIEPVVDPGVGGGSDGSASDMTENASDLLAEIEADYQAGELTLAELEGLGEERDVAIRVVERDGESLEVTADWRNDRINVAVDGELVTAIIGVG